MTFVVDYIRYTETYPDFLNTFIFMSSDGPLITTSRVYFTITHIQLKHIIEEDIAELCHKLPLSELNLKQIQDKFYNSSVNLIINNDYIHMFDVIAMIFRGSICVSLLHAMKEHGHNVWLNLTNLKSELMSLIPFLSKYGIVAEQEAKICIEWFNTHHVFPPAVQAILEKEKVCTAVVNDLTDVVIEKLESAFIDGSVEMVMKRLRENVIEKLQQKRQRT